MVGPEWWETFRALPVDRLIEERNRTLNNLIAQQSNPEDSRKIIDEQGVSTGKYRIVRAELEKKQEALGRLNRILLEKRPELASQIETEMQQTGVLNPPKQFFTQEGLNKLTSGRTDALSTWFDGFTPFNPQQQARPAQQPAQQLFQQPVQRSYIPQFTQQTAPQLSFAPLQNNISNLQQQPVSFNFLQNTANLPQLTGRPFLQPNYSQQQGLLNVSQPSSIINATQVLNKYLNPLGLLNGQMW